MDRARFASTIVAWGVLLLAAAVEARMPSLRAAAATNTPRPYQPVAVIVPAAPADTSFAAFRTELAAVARRRVYGELARLASSAATAADGTRWRILPRRRPPRRSMGGRT